jgi:tetratricopeptide (TPR) repeat protein
LRHDPAHEVAFEKVLAPLLRNRKYDEARSFSDRCLAVNRASCICQETRADVALGQQALQDAQTRATTAALACPASALAKAIRAETLVLLGNPQQGLSEAQAALALGRDEGRLRTVVALAFYLLQAYPEATREAHAAIEAGAGREAKLLAGRLALHDHDPDGAERFLRPLSQTDPLDAEVIYELAAVAEERGQLDAARRGYLDALRLDAKRPEARYRLTLLALKRDDRDEARRYAREFIQSWPSDRRAMELADAVGIARPQLSDRKPPAH